MRLRNVAYLWRTAVGIPQPRRHKCEICGDIEECAECTDAMLKARPGSTVLYARRLVFGGNRQDSAPEGFTKAANTHWRCSKCRLKVEVENQGKSRKN